jgi:hypothetical protein
VKAFLPAFTDCIENPLHARHWNGLPLGGYWEVLRHRKLVTSIAPPVSGSSGTISFGGLLLSILAAYGTSVFFGTVVHAAEECFEAQIYYSTRISLMPQNNFNTAHTAADRL